MDRGRVIAVDIYFQRRASREYVGRLECKEGEFIFTYAEKYLYNLKSIPLGVELPLTAQEFRSPDLFPSLEDRIPSRRNPAYPEYCEQMGIATDEKDPLTLLATLGRKGPSSFICTPIYDDDFSAQHLIAFRKALGLSVREFADAFSLAPSTINGIEKGRLGGKDALKRIQLYQRVHQAALFELTRNRNKISDQKFEAACKAIKTATEKERQGSIG